MLMELSLPVQCREHWPKRRFVNGLIEKSRGQIAIALPDDANEAAEEITPAVGRRQPLKSENQPAPRSARIGRRSSESLTKDVGTSASSEHIGQKLIEYDVVASNEFAKLPAASV